MDSRLHPHDVILFQGDSITNAFRMPQEINDAYQLGAGYALMVASRLRLAWPDAAVRAVNRGVSGNAVANLLARWEEDCLALKPTVVSLLVGINDTGRDVSGTSGATADDYTRDYRHLLTWTRRELPDVRFVLCEPFTLLVGNVTAAWRDNLRPRQQIVRDLAQAFDAVFVPLQRPFDAACRQAPPDYWIYDGIHPTAAGHALIAREWLAAVAPAVAG